MSNFFAPMLSLAKSRKFYVTLFGAIVIYLSSKFGITPELVLLEGLGTALGVYGVSNG